MLSLDDISAIHIISIHTTYSYHAGISGAKQLSDQNVLAKKTLCCLYT